MGKTRGFFALVGVTVERSGGNNPTTLVATRRPTLDGGLTAWRAASARIVRTTD